MVISLGEQYSYWGKTFSRIRQHLGGQSIPAIPKLRMETSSAHMAIHRLCVGTPHSGQVCLNAEHSIRTLQQSFQRPNVRRGRCFSPTGLGNRKQLCKSPIQASTASGRDHPAAESSSNSDCPVVADPSMVPPAQTHVHCTTNQITKPSIMQRQDGFHDRTNEKSSMADIRLASVWSDRLRQDGWSDRAASQISLHWATSTMSLYDRQINKYSSYCHSRVGQFPASHGHSNVLADFLCQVADSSDRPESILKSSSAAISCYYHGLGMTSPMESRDIRTLMSALVKSGTKRPAGRTPVMPADVFYHLFKSWPDNMLLDISRLRLKAVTLLALSLMTRPSDMAPKATLFDSETGRKEQVVFARKQVQFHQDGAATFLFFGTKNDSARTGFEVRIPGCSDTKWIRCRLCTVT